jgi:hypothetical protein
VLKKVYFDPNLFQSTNAHGDIHTLYAEIDFHDTNMPNALAKFKDQWVIRIDQGLSPLDAVMTLYHELTHLVYDFLMLLRKYESMQKVTVETFPEYRLSDLYKIQTEYFAHFFTSNVSFSFLELIGHDQNYVFNQAGIHLPGDIAYKTACAYSTKIRTQFNILYNHLLSFFGSDPSKTPSYQALTPQADFLFQKVGNAHTASVIAAQNIQDFDGLANLLFDMNKCANPNDKQLLLLNPTTLDSMQTRIFRTRESYHHFLQEIWK